MASPAHVKKLLVEGNTDKRVVPFLIESNGVQWEVSGKPVVHIEAQNGVEDILEPGVVEAEIRASGLEALGVIVDANGDAAERWNQIRRRIRGEFPSLPNSMPAGGLQVAGHSS